MKKKIETRQVEFDQKSLENGTELVQLVLNEFELRNPIVELLDSIDHRNAKVVTDSGNYFLKILVSDHTEAGLHSRLHFAGFLRDGGLSVPPTIATKTGLRSASVCVGSEKRQAVMYQWIDGETLGRHAVEQWVERCGELLARLHIRSQEYNPPDGLEFRPWDDVYAPAEDGWLRQFLAYSPLDDPEKEVIERERRKHEASMHD